MTELAHLMADKHWPYIWPCYLLAVLTFSGLALRAVLALRRWEKAAAEDDPSASSPSS